VYGVTAEHRHDRWAKYSFLPDSGEDCERIDVHPDVWPRIVAGGSVCFWEFEATAKGDAIASTGAAVVDTPSVHLWADPYRHSALYPILRDRWQLVVVVCDSDWASNRLVREPVRDCVLDLRAAGIPAVAAAPRSKCGEVVCEADHGPDADVKVGPDDMLAAVGREPWGGQLGELWVQRIEVAPLPAPLVANPQQARSLDALESAALELADRGGRAVVGQKFVGGLTGLHPSTISRGLDRLEDLERLDSIDEPVPARFGQGSPTRVVKLRPDVLERRYDAEPETLRDYVARLGLEPPVEVSRW
jgi:hypothetical protein